MIAHWRRSTPQGTKRRRGMAEAVVDAFALVDLLSGDLLLDNELVAQCGVGSLVTPCTHRRTSMPRSFDVPPTTEVVGLRALFGQSAADGRWLPIGYRRGRGSRPLGSETPAELGVSVGLGGFEPPTSCSQSRRANQTALQPVFVSC
jgi:hypothetical protein